MAPQTSTGSRTNDTPYGIEPTWFPRRAGDRLLVGIFRATFVVVFAPFRLVWALLGWTKVHWALLDILSLPGLVLRLLGSLGGERGKRWGRRANALEHTQLVCRLCPARRRALRDPEGGGVCVWNRRWNEGNFEITPSFGGKSWLTQYVGRTDLEGFKELSQPSTPEQRTPGAPTTRPWPKPMTATVSVLLWVLLAIVLVATTAACGYLVKRPKQLTASDWTDLGAVPEAQHRYPPQGLTVAGDTLVFSNHWSDSRSALYRIVPATMEISEPVYMPAEATHTSGLAFDGQFLWAVDYATGKVYRIDEERTFAEGQAAVLASYDTGLDGASACTIVTVDDVRYLAVSDFFHSRRTYLIRLEDVEGMKGDLRDRAWLSYRNGGFSQGLTWDGRYLYESENNVGVDRIEILDVAEALRKRDADLIRRLGSVSAPSESVEDLAVFDGQLWTSDESSYRFYRIPMDRVRPANRGPVLAPREEPK